MRIGCEEKTFDAETLSRGDWTRRKRSIRTRQQSSRFARSNPARHARKTTTSFPSFFLAFSASSSASPRLRVKSCFTGGSQ
jgi:hypothetical protein